MKLIDLGFLREFSDNKRIVQGTPGYLPFQIFKRSKTDQEKMDLFALGVTIGEIVNY